MNKLAKRISLLLLVWFCLLNIQCLANASAETVEQKETLEVLLFFGSSGDIRLVSNVCVRIENSTVGPPINKSLEALNDGFIKATFHFAGLGKEFSVVLNTFFDPSIGNETASSYTDDIAEEFLKVFGYQNFTLLRQWQGIEESKMRVYRAFGHGRYNKAETSKFLKYVPPGGFSRFIDGLIDKYVSKDLETGLYLPCYTLKKIGSDFYWDVELTGVTTIDHLPKDAREYSKSISVNELLNSDASLIDEPSENEEIIILAEKNRTVRLSGEIKTFTMDIQEIHPEGYTIAESKDWSNEIEIRYEHPFKMEDIVIYVIIDSVTHPQPYSIPPRILIPLLGIIICSVVLVATIVYAKKKQKEGERNG